MKSYIVRVEGLVPRSDQIAVQAETPDEAAEKAVQIATDEGFHDAVALQPVEVATLVVPHK